MLVSIAKLLSKEVASVTSHQQDIKVPVATTPLPTWVLQIVLIFANLIGKKGFLIVALFRISSTINKIEYLLWSLAAVLM